MKIIENEIPFFQTLLKLLKNQFSMESEFTLYGWSKSYDHGVVAIENGRITDRKIGDCGNSLGLGVIRRATTSDIKCNYVTRIREGKVLLSSTMYIKNDDRQALGALCINMGISERTKIKEYLDSSLPEELNKKNSNEELFVTDVSDLLVYLIDQGINNIGRPASEMTKEDKMRALYFLDDRGAFLISESSTKICQILEISKFTLYNYLNKVRERKEPI